MRVAVGLAGHVVAVVAAKGGEGFGPFVDVVDDAAFGIVDIDACGDVHGGDEDHAVGDAGFGDGGGDLVGDIHVLAVFFGVKPEILSVKLHRFPPSIVSHAIRPNPPN